MKTLIKKLLFILVIISPFSTFAQTPPEDIAPVDVSVVVNLYEMNDLWTVLLGDTSELTQEDLDYIQSQIILWAKEIKEVQDQEWDALMQEEADNQ